MSTQPSVLRILIVGAGIGGLAAATRLAQTGHNVSVYERRPDLVEFGAGIQCPPNVMRIFKGWNLAGNVGMYTSEPDKILVRRYESGEVKGIIRTPSSRVLHRADLQRVLHEAAITAGATIFFGKQVTYLNADEPCLTFEDGSTAVGDLIVGADGMPHFPLLTNRFYCIRSFVRRDVLHAGGIELHLTDECLFRTMIPKSAVGIEQKLLDFFDQSTVNVWAGPGKHLVMYPVRQGSLLNLVWNDHGDGEVGSWNEPADLDDLRERFALFEAPVRRLLDYAQECSKWRVAELPPLPHWTSKSKKVVLLGDAAHAMIPHVAQGGAQAIEDAAVLAQLLSRSRSKNDIPHLTEAFEALRKPRTERIQDAARLNMMYWQLPDGLEQEQRDTKLSETLKIKEDMREGHRENRLEVKPDKNARFGEIGFQHWLYDTDVVREAAETLSLM